MYIVINKHDPEEKYQFHFETASYMDIDDYSIDLSDFLNENPGLKEFFEEKILKGLGWNSDTDTMQISLEKSDAASAVAEGSDFSQDFVMSVLIGEAYEHFQFDYGVDGYSINNAFDMLNEQSVKELSELGINSVEDLDEHPDVKREFKNAILNAEENAAIDACEKDLASALEDVGVYAYNGYIISDSDDLCYDLTKDEVLDNMDFFINNDYSFEDFVYETIGEEINFDEPRYGWTGTVSDEDFNEILLDRLSWLD